MPSAQNKIQIVDTHETSETLAVTRLQRVGYQINRTLLDINIDSILPNLSFFDQTHAQQGVPAVRWVQVAITAAGVDRPGVPRPTTANFQVALGWACGIVLRRYPVVVLTIVVTDPLPSVAHHVIQTKGVGPVTAHGGCEGVAVVSGHGHVLPAGPVRRSGGVKGVGPLRR